MVKVANMHFTFISGNPGKVAQVQAYLDYPFSHQKLDLTEIQSLDLEEIVQHKATEAYRQIKTPVLIEDTSLTFHALGKLPGTLIKWFLNEMGTTKLSQLLDSFADRKATAQVCFGLYDGKTLKTFTAAIEGSIAPQPRGNLDFGWGPLFIPQGEEKTWGEMNQEEQRPSAIRRIALEKLATYLKSTQS